MADSTVIGRSTFVRGRVQGTGDLEIAGRIEGDVQASGEVLVDTSGLVAADVSARRIVVRGAVRGNLTADEAVVIEAGARVVGDLRAPRVAIAQGGLVRGHVQTAAADGRPKTTAARASTSLPARTAAPTAPVARPSHASAPAKPAQVPAKPAQAPAKPAPAKAAPTPVVKVGANGVRATATARGARPGPPPPVVPVLKKGTKALQKKRG